MTRPGLYSPRRCRPDGGPLSSTPASRVVGCRLVAGVLSLTPAFGLAAEATELPAVSVHGDRDRDAGYAPTTSSTATRGAAALRDVPQSVSVVTGEVLRDQNATSMQDALRNVPGVSFSSGDGQRDQVYIRGITAIADWFVDGVRDDALYFRDLADTERIEVIKGPAAVLYGRGSSGGLVNRVTKKPQFDESFGEVGLGVGNHRYRRATLDMNLPIDDRIAFRLNLAREDSGSFRNQQFVDRYAIAPSVAVRLTPATTLLLQYTNARDRRITDFGIPALNGRPVNMPVSTYYGSADARRDDHFMAKMEALTATLEHRFSDTLSLRNTTRYYRFDLDRFNTIPSGTTDPVALTVGRTRGFILRDEHGWFNQTDLTWRNRLGGFEQQWLAGVEVGVQDKRVWSASSPVGYDRVPLYDPVVAPPPIPEASYRAAGAIPSDSRFETRAIYLQDLITVAPQWKAMVGVRYDDYGQQTRFDRELAPLERTDKRLSPRAGIVWQPSATQSYYLSFTRSFQPSAETFALAANNADNRPEITENHEIGTRLDLLDGRLAFTGALFNLERSNIKNTDPTNPARQINVGKQRTRGLELALAGRVGEHWTVTTGYALLDAKMVRSLATVNQQQLPVGPAIPVEGQTAPLTPRHSAFAWAIRDFGHGLRAGGGVNAVSARYTSLTNRVTLPGYATIDLMGSWAFDRYELALNLRNLADRRYYVSAHGSIDNLIMPGESRTVMMTMRARW